MNQPQNARPTRRLISTLGLASAAALTLGACSSQAPETETSDPPDRSTESSAPPAGEPTDAPSGDPTGGTDETAAPESPSDDGSPAEGQTMELQEGESAELAHFTVTLHSSEPQPDGLYEAYDIEVCYTSEHPEQNADGTTRVSTDPWSLLVVDGESTNEPEWLPISEFEQTSEKSPAFEETSLQVGDCQRGWLTADHGNPDLQFTGVRYAPADFGDEVTWTIS